MAETRSTADGMMSWKEEFLPTERTRTARCGSLRATSTKKKAKDLRMTIGGAQGAPPSLSHLKGERKVSEAMYCNPDVCQCCQYIGEGDSWCDEIGEIVLEDWQPTEDFMGTGCPYLEE